MGSISGRATTIASCFQQTLLWEQEIMEMRGSTLSSAFFRPKINLLDWPPCPQPPQQLDTHSPLMWCSQWGGKLSSHWAPSCSCCWSTDPSPVLARAWELGWRRGQEQGTASLTHLHSPTGKDTEGKANKIFKVEVSQVFTKSPNFPSSSLLEITKQNMTKKKIKVRIFSKSKKKKKA